MTYHDFIKSDLDRLKIESSDNYIDVIYRHIIGLDFPAKNQESRDSIIFDALKTANEI